MASASDLPNHSRRNNSIVPLVIPKLPKIFSYALSADRTETSPPSDPLRRTGKLFGGMFRDVKNRLPYYRSDYTDASSFQCLASIAFMFFAAFAPSITFGGLMGMFLALMAAITVMFEGSYLVGYVTRFTEDIFAALISTIFIVESVKFIKETFKKHPVMEFSWYKLHYCQWASEETRGNNNSTTPDSKGNLSNLEAGDIANSTTTSLTLSTTDVVYNCQKPNKALLTLNFMLATFALAYLLKRLRTSHYLGRRLRRAIGDFGIIIAIVVVSGFHHFTFQKEPALKLLGISNKFAFTNTTARGGPGQIFMSFDLQDNWWQVVLVALAAAMLLFILMFVETEIIELLVIKKDRGLKKGSGFHWDLLLVGLLAFLCSLLGLPWMSAAAVQTLAHSSSLTVMKRPAQGERPSVDYVLEQRVTTIGVAVLIGSCIFAGNVLKFLPLCVLFGVFLYLGTMNLIGIQFLNRIILLFIPKKHFPDISYCQEIKMWRMHTYTGIQTLCFAGVLAVKFFKQSSTPYVSLAFPFALMVIAVIRMLVLPRIFTSLELQALDGHQEDELEKEDVDLYEEAHGLGV